MQVWEWVHVAAAAMVVVLGVVHSRKVWVALAPGVVLYGIDLAHRWLQASRTATASISASGNVISAVVPLEVCHAPASSDKLSIPSTPHTHAMQSGVSRCLARKHQEAHCLELFLCSLQRACTLPPPRIHQHLSLACILLQ